MSESTRIEIQGVILKKSRNGFYQQRYIKSQGPMLRYVSSWCDVMWFDCNNVNNNDSDLLSKSR